MGKENKETKNNLEKELKNPFQTKIAEEYLKNFKENGYDAYYFKRKLGNIKEKTFMKVINIILTTRFREEKYILN